MNVRLSVPYDLVIHWSLYCSGSIQYILVSWLLNFFSWWVWLKLMNQLIYTLPPKKKGAMKMYLLAPITPKDVNVFISITKIDCQLMPLRSCSCTEHTTAFFPTPHTPSHLYLVFFRNEEGGFSGQD